MTSDAFIWVWLPGDAEPVVCGRLRDFDGELRFAYGRGYLERESAIALDPRELPLSAGWFRPRIGEMPGIIRDASPDAWGRRVLHHRFPSDSLAEMDFLVRTGPDRIGAMEVNRSKTAYAPDEWTPATLDELASAADRVERGEPLPEPLDDALLHGSSVGGARPKALIDGARAKYIAKFSSGTDVYPVIRCEYAAMWLARRCGVDVPRFKLLRSMGKDVLLVERFDRERGESGWRRRFLASSLTTQGLHETEARWASYLDLAGFIRRYGASPEADNAALFRRMVFNIVIGNTDDHARNHSFFWDGRHYRLTPAYDICPMLRSGLTANQAMVVGAEGRPSTLRNALSEAGVFGLSPASAREGVDAMVQTVESEWPDAADAAGLTRVQSDLLRRATVLSPGIFY